MTARDSDATFLISRTPPTEPARRVGQAAQADTIVQGIVLRAGYHRDRRFQCVCARNQLFVARLQMIGAGLAVVVQRDAIGGADHHVLPPGPRRRLALLRRYRVASGGGQRC